MAHFLKLYFYRLNCVSKHIKHVDKSIIDSECLFYFFSLVFTIIKNFKERTQFLDNVGVQQLHLILNEKLFNTMGGTENIPFVVKNNNLITMN